MFETLGDQQRPRDDTLRERIAREGNGLRRAVLDDARSRFGSARPMHYGLALEGLAQFVDDDAIVLGDIGSHNQWTRLVVQTRNRDTFHPEGYWGAMGFALPAALAAKLARPDKKVIGVTGDGCFLMASADFATAVEHGINPVIVILNDRQYGMIVGMQQAYYGRSSATELDGPDFVAFARAFGGDGARVESPERVGGGAGAWSGERTHLRHRRHLRPSPSRLRFRSCIAMTMRRRHAGYREVTART